SIATPAAAPEATSTTEQQVKTYLGEILPETEPALFRPGSVSTGAIELSLAIHPNLQELYFTRLESGKAIILVSRQTDDGWTTPAPASFSGEYDDVNPFISADGQKLYFSSKRPLARSATPDEPYRIWFVERDGDGWANPTRLTLPLESANGESSPTLTHDGTLYYVADYPELGGNGLYRAQLVNEMYQTPKKIDLLVDTGQIVEVEPFVAPDESFVLFYSAGRPDNLMPNSKTGDIYIAFRDSQGQWSAPRNVGQPVNSTAEESTPTLSPDGQYLFFASNRGGNRRFPDLYWVEAAFLQTLRPDTAGRGELPLTFNALLHGFDFDGPVDETALTPPVQATTPVNTFEGRLELLGERESGHIEMVRGNLEPDHAYLPEFDFKFVQSDGYLIPVQRGQIIADHPLWNIILEPGRVWQEAGDGDFSRASLPFALITKGGNATFNGTLTFLFDAHSVSKVWYQITQETTTYARANLWGLLDAVYHSEPVGGAEQIRADFAAELVGRLPAKPIQALAEEYPGVDVSAFGRGVTPAHMTWYGVMVNGVNYVGGCQTRFGTYPYCESMRATSYSTAKSAFVGVALMRLAQKYSLGVTDLLIKDYVPEYTVSPGDWEHVTFNHTLDMSTGNYVSNGFMADDTGVKMNEFYGAQPYSARIAAAFTAPSAAAPGEQWVYRTSDTFILTRALHNYLQSQEGPEADIYRFVVDEVYRPLGLGPGVFTTMRTADNNWQGQAEGGYGTWWIPDDIAKLALLLNNNGGRINGEQVLHPGLLAATMQRDPGDRGVKIDRRQMYNNAFWATHYTKSDGFDCDFWITEMQGVSGNVVALFPNGITYYYFSDNQEFTWDAALRESDKMIPLCAPAQTPTPTPQPVAPAVKNLRETIDFSTGKGPVYSQDWSPDGRLLVTADYDQVRVWDI
ncbi:MAG: PD40 domain-containing protein, partial [Anaerolineae bacterium]|nr:PD40 domain-containing protein [Anaerolineae bacterium]